MTKTLLPDPSENRAAAWFSNPFKMIVLLVMISFGSIGSSNAQKEYAHNQMSPIITTPCTLCGVTNPNNPVDLADLEDYSTVSIPMGMYDVSLGQMLIFPSLNAYEGSDSLIIRIGASLPSDLDMLFEQVYVETYNDATSNQDIMYATGSNFRIVDGNSVELAMKPKKKFDRVKITLTTSNPTALWNLRIYSAYRKKANLPDAHGIMYVKKGSDGDGSSWASAKGELGEALRIAAADADIKQIWVAGGTYHPTDIASDAGTGSDLRNRSFLLKNNVKLYGGFAGTETAISQRDLSIAANRSILSGDMNDDDAPTGSATGDFIIHVLIASKGNFLLDGFTVMRGNAQFPGIPVTVDGFSLSGNQGGGITVLSSNMEITNCIIKANVGSQGGGISCEQSALKVSNTQITGNLGLNGAGVFGNNSSLMLVNTTISGNQGVGGAVRSIGTSTTISNSIIYGNGSHITGDQAIVTNSIVSGGYPGTNVSGNNPSFVNPQSFNVIPNSLGDYSLQSVSPAIDKGDNSKINAVNTASIAPETMADHTAGAACSGLVCNVENPDLATDASSYTDYTELICGGGSAHLDVSWGNRNIQPGEFVGFVITSTNLPLNQTLLGNIKIVLLDGTGNEVQTQNGFTNAQIATLDGQTVNYIGITAITHAASARIHITQLSGLFTSLGVNGAFIWPFGLNTTLTKDLAGNPRVNGGKVDLGAYETQMAGQSITVSDLTKTYGNTDFKPGFTASSGLTVSYLSADNSIAEAYQDVNDGNAWKIKIKKTGNVNITAKQAGNGAFYPAPDAVFELGIGKKSVTLAIGSSTNITKVYDGNTLGAIAVTDLEFAGGDIINNDDVQPLLSSTTVNYDNQNAGTGKTIALPLSSLSLTGDDAGNYEIGNSAVLTFNNAVIVPAAVSITANAQTKMYGEADPAFTYTATGLIGSDVANGGLSRDPGENTGAYNITQGTLSAGSNYQISFTGAQLTITKATQTITWTQTNLEAGCDGATTIQLLATSNSNLPITYTVSNTAIATVNGDILTPLSGGATTITAFQEGDQNHEAAATVVKDFKSSLAGAIRQQFSDVLIFDNTSGNYVQWQWYKNGNAIPGATKAYYSEAAALNGTFHVVVTDKNGNSVEACPLTASGSASTRGIKVNPNPAKPGSTITVTCNYNTSALAGARLLLTTASGSQVQQVTNVQPVTQLTLPATSGLYIITLVLPTGEKASVNVLSK